MMEDGYWRMDEKDKDGVIRFLQNLINEIDFGLYVVDKISQDVQSVPVNDGHVFIGWNERYRKLTIIYRII